MLQVSARLVTAVSTLAAMSCIVSQTSHAPSTRPPLIEEDGGAAKRLVFGDALNQPRDSFQVTIRSMGRPDLAAAGKFAIGCISAEPGQKRKVRITSPDGPGGAWDEACTSREQLAEVELAVLPYRLSLTPFYTGPLGMVRPVDAVSYNASTDLSPPYTMTIGFVRAGDVVEVHWGPR